MKYNKVSLLFWVMLTAGAAAFAQSPGTLTVEITGARSDNGVIRVLVFSSEKGFPNDAGLAVAMVPEARLENGRAVVEIEGLPAGELAVAVIHDEDGDGEVDTNFLGIPVEGLGVSNNPDLKGPPKFRDAAFRYSGGKQGITVAVMYLFKKKGS